MDDDLIKLILVIIVIIIILYALGYIDVSQLFAVETMPSSGSSIGVGGLG